MLLHSSHSTATTAAAADRYNKPVELWGGGRRDESDYDRRRKVARQGDCQSSPSAVVQFSGLAVLLEPFGWSLALRPLLYRIYR